ncbi:MAG: hypothetical protein ACI4EK_08375 [Wujia sp.]
MAMIYLIALVALFLIMVIASIAVAVSAARRKKRIDEDYEDDIEETDTYSEEEYDESQEEQTYEEAYDETYDESWEDTQEESADITEEEESIFDEADELPDDLYVDNLDEEIVPTEDEQEYVDEPTQEIDTESVKTRRQEGTMADTDEENALPADDEENDEEADRDEIADEETKMPSADEVISEEDNSYMEDTDELTQPEEIAEQEELQEELPEELEEPKSRKHSKKEKKNKKNKKRSKGDNEDIEIFEEASLETELEETEEPAEKESVEQESTEYAGDDTDYLEDSAFAPPTMLSNEALAASVKEAEAMGAAIMGGLKAANVSAGTMFDISEELSGYGSKRGKRSKSKVASDDEFYWYNKEDVASRPSRRPAEMYYHYFNIASDCIEDLLVEMYDCALVRTEEIRYIAYGIEPRAVSMKQIMSGGYDAGVGKTKDPSPQDMIRIYEKWCGYVEHLFDKVEIHADEYTIQEIRKQLCEYGKNDIDVLLEGK